MKLNIKTAIFAISTTSTISAIGAMCLSAAFIGTANAAPAPGEMKARMQKMDANGDGKISRDEASKYKNLAKVFDKIDTNNDGYLSKDELQAHRAKKAQGKFKAIDNNQDGRISRAEADAKAPMLAKNFDKLDVNKDGFIDKQEMSAARKYRQR